MILLLAAAAISLTHSPGALNPAVRQETIRQTICVAGWTDTVRPPSSYTDKVKAQQMAARQLKGEPADYEEDHFVPLVLGGHPTDPANLWPQPMAEARRKDTVERQLRDQVCAGRLPLGEAQRRIKHWRRYVVESGK